MTKKMETYDFQDMLRWCLVFSSNVQVTTHKLTQCNVITSLGAKPLPSPQFTLVFWQTILKASTECSNGLGLFCTYQQGSFSKQYMSCMTDIISCCYFNCHYARQWQKNIFTVSQNVLAIQSFSTNFASMDLNAWLQPCRHWLTENNGCSAMLHSPLGAQPRPRSMHNPWEFVSGCTSAWMKKVKFMQISLCFWFLCLKNPTSKTFYVRCFLLKMESLPPLQSRSASGYHDDQLFSWHPCVMSLSMGHRQLGPGIWQKGFVGIDQRSR